MPTGNSLESDRLQYSGEGHREKAVNGIRRYISSVVYRKSWRFGAQFLEIFLAEGYGFNLKYLVVLYLYII